jgi:hypothetical protein
VAVAVTAGDRGHGSVAEEASKLLRAVQGWAGEQLRPTDPAGGAAGSLECRVCPVCRALGTVREARPDLFDSLSAAASAVGVAVTDLVRQHDVDGDAFADHVEVHERQWPSGHAPDIERIDIS